MLKHNLHPKNLRQQLGWRGCFTDRIDTFEMIWYKMTPYKIIPLEEREKEYKICIKRGHTASGNGYRDSQQWHICEFCGTQYRFEEKRELMERNIPQNKD